MTSIRGRTSLLVAASIAALLALGGVTLFAVVRTALTRQFDDGLAARAAALQSLTRSDAGSVEIDIAGEVLPRYQPGAEAEFFVAWTRREHGWRELERSESLRGAAWHDIPPEPGTGDQPLPDGRPGRAVTVEFVPISEHEGADESDARPGALREPAPSPQSPDGAPAVRILAAQSRAPLDRSLWAIGLSTGGVGIALVLASLGASRWAVRRGTRPLESLSARVATLGPDTLDQRLAPDRLPIELAPFAERLNDLLARLGDAFARERRFTSAASHELRTPIAELRMLLEVGLTRARSPGQWEETARDGLGVLDRAQRLTVALLRLSRATAPIDEHRDAPADLAAILRRQAARAPELGGHDPALLSVSAPATMPARIDPALAAAIIGNLIDNALRHGDVRPDRPVRCVASREGDAASVVIINHAPTLTHADLPMLFEPFWRKDAARGATGGFGLGLAVGRALAESTGSSLEGAIDSENNLSVTLRCRVDFRTSQVAPPSPAS